MRDELNEELTLMLLYLNSWQEKLGDFQVTRSWKGYDYATLNLLSEKGLIDGSGRKKSVYFYPQGVEEAKRLFEKYGLKID
ncbi:hypothetical protein I6N95_00555 [Vagococcus sp. BWB3-3]|uniref:DUF6429 domain-containing protein n=1 Tax=Vagococcus allomyrinae TaxID=2794353 RepID=A0A940P1T3_9ENTE|nr:DUF6429 family protein [Vagococcus allomyrinae]MBP1039485.1 hypothetical protein [Vagococcus allomyrinae]